MLFAALVAMLFALNRAPEDRAPEDRAPADQAPAWTAPRAPNCRGVEVSQTADAQAALSAHPRGTVFCLTGTLKLASPLRPKEGQHLVGPASLIPAPGSRAMYGIETAHRNVIDSLELSGFDMAIRNQGDHVVIRRSSLHDGARSGIGGPGDDAVIERNHIYRNGSPEYFGCCAAGMKFVGQRVTVKGNYVHDNNANGIWADLNANDAVIEGNISVDNFRSGIFYEISAGGVIRNNKVMRNNVQHGEYTGGITIGSSQNVQVYGNHLEDNFLYGIRVWEDADREPIRDVVIHHNTLEGDRIGGCELVRCYSNP